MSTQELIQNKMQLTETEAERIHDGDSDLYETVEYGDWSQDHKYQHLEGFIVKDNLGFTYELVGVMRSGSPFTDWYYQYDGVELVRVEKQQVTTEQWVAV